MVGSDFATWILGTAGHIDHGKTTLVRALTGIDADRLPEEKQRGMTIDLGYAELNLGAVRLGVIDVPGHERFIKNMLAGSATIDMVLLVVAADDGVMPQTREHLAILNLLGVKWGVVAITKCDIRTKEWIDLVADEVRSVLRRTSLAAAPIVRTSVSIGKESWGLDELKSQLLHTCSHLDRPAESELFRLPIDRSFTIEGRGTVVTGSVWSGTARLGEDLELVPQGRSVSIRALENHNRKVTEIHRGERGAINLPGIPHTEIRRGHELATPGYLKSAGLLTVELYALADIPRPIQNRSRLRLHIGTQEVIARIALFDRRNLEPGDAALAQLICQKPATAICGQPFIVRSESPRTTLGGGRVLQPGAVRLRRADRDVQSRLQSLGGEDPDDRVDAALYFLGTKPWTLVDVCRNANVMPTIARDALSRLVANGRLLEFAVRSTSKRMLHSEIVSDLERRIVMSVVSSLKACAPLRAGISRQQLCSKFVDMAEHELVNLLIQRLVARKELEANDSTVCIPGYTPQLSSRQAAALDEIVAIFHDAGACPPGLSELAKLNGLPVAETNSLLQHAVRQNQLVQLAEGLYLSARFEKEIRRRIIQAIENRGPMTVGQIKDLLQTSRKYAVPICEYLDKVGLTRRMGDLRMLA